MPPISSCLNTGLAYPEVTQVICRVPSTLFSQAPWYTLPAHLCRFRVRSIWWGYFLEPLRSLLNPIRANYLRDPSHPTRPTNINVVPIDYPLRARLRGRLTLLRLALSRNPWTFGESVSHTLCRYSRQHSHFPALQPISRSTFTAQGTLRYHASRRTHPQLRLVA